MYISILYIITSSVITWLGIMVMSIFINLSRSFASSSYPGDLTISQQYLYLISATIGFIAVQFVLRVFMKRINKVLPDILFNMVIIISTTVFTIFSIIFIFNN